MTDYELKKRRAGCTGMFWRADPTNSGPKLAPNANSINWPRDGALLRGRVVVDSKGGRWLLTDQVKQVGDKESWIDAPAGAAMPFEYDDHYYLEARSWFKNKPTTPPSVVQKVMVFNMWGSADGIQNDNEEKP